MLLGFVLGKLMEENLRRALIISRGDPWVFLTRKIDAVIFGQPVGSCSAASCSPSRRGF